MKNIETLKQEIADRGVYVGTKHKRIFLPHTELSLQDLKRMGFKTSALSIPERGAFKVKSYRHPTELLHAHPYRTGWTIHQDTSGMSLKHLFKEGIPAFYYNLIKTKEDMSEIVKREAKEIFLDSMTGFEEVFGNKTAKLNIIGRLINASKCREE